MAGTKGKGSTCAFAASILKSAGLRTGLYTSPHLLDFRERFRVDGTMISEAEMASIVEKIRPFAGRDLTYFEVTTACAFLHFAEQNVDAAVIEVGMGGRLDATNVVQPQGTVLTPIGLDHLSKLGSRIERIAREKAGILKSGVPAVVSPQPEGAWEVIRETADSLRVPLHRVEKEIRLENLRISPEGTGADLFSPAGSYRGLHIPLPGRHQVDNAAAAIRAAELFFERKGASLPQRAVLSGILQTEWPGRCQVIAGEPTVVLDGAQSSESARALRSAVEQFFPGRGVILVIGLSTDKDLEGIAGVLGPWAGRIILTQANVPRAEPIERLERLFEAFPARRETDASVDAALRRACETDLPGEIVVVTGSLFVVAEALRFLRASVPVGRQPAP